MLFHWIRRLRPTTASCSCALEPGTKGTTSSVRWPGDVSSPIGGGSVAAMPLHLCRRRISTR
jgi:hypothetical protein